jgi:hypothetical protein
MSHLAANEERTEGHSGLTFSGPSKVMIKVQPMITPSRTPSDAASKQASVRIKTTLPPNTAAEGPKPRLTLNLGVIRYILPLDGRPPILTSPRFDLCRPGRGHVTQLIGDPGKGCSEGGRR